MFSKIEGHIKNKLKDIVFIELKEDKKVKMGDSVIDSTIPLPITINDVVDKVKGSGKTDFSLKQIIQGMVLVIGIDRNFKYNDVYIRFLKNIDKNINNNIINQGILYAENNQKIDALICFKAAIHLDNEDINALYNYARCCEELATSKEEGNEDFEKEALDVFEKIVFDFPKFPLAYYHLGFHYANKKLYKKAEITWKSAIENGIDENKKLEILNKLNDLEDKIRYEEGYTYVLNGEFQRGLEILKELEKKNSDWWNLLFFIGLAYRNLNQFHEAIEYFKRVIRIKSGQVQSYNEIGLCLISIGDVEEAIKYFKKALKLKADEPEILCNYGIALLQKGDIQEGAKYIQKSYELNPEDEVTKAWIERLSL